MNVVSPLTIETLLAEAPMLLAYASSRLHDHQEAEEAVQDCILAAWAQRESFEGRASVRTWLVSILRHKILDRLRARRRRPDRPDPSASVAHYEDEFDPLESCFTPHGAWKIDPTYAMDSLKDCPHESTLRAEIQGLIRLCLEALPERLRHLFSLRELDQLDTKEAASLAGVSASSAPVLLTRARLRLRDCLQQRLAHYR